MSSSTANSGSAISFLSFTTVADNANLHLLPIHGSPTNRASKDNAHVPIEEPTFWAIQTGGYKTLKSSLSITVRNDRWSKVDAFVRMGLAVQGQLLVRQAGHIQLGGATQDKMLARLDRVLGLSVF